MKEKENETRREIIAIAVLTGILFLTSYAFADPSGPTAINVTSNTTATATSGQIVNISGGYVAKLNVTAVTQNPHWKAFAGWIDGRFTLDDAAGATIYDWTLASISGEVYATRDSGSIEWGSIQCANATQVETEDTVLIHTGEDNINTTFTIDSNSLTYVVAGTSITANSCYATNTYVNNVTQGTEFEETILYDATSLVFASVLEADETGYDGATYDFQMIVPENASETFTGATAYYIYVELS